MNDVTPRTPRRPLFWTDTILDLCDLIVDLSDSAYIVGGAVRDAYLHRPIKDVDITVADDAIRYARQVTNKLDGDLFIMDRERGVARVILNTLEGRLIIDVAQLRAEDLLHDLYDRDFTINAMAVALDDLENLIDPLNAEDDIAVKRLRRCSPDSIANDPIRALRGIRQSVQFKLRIEPETLKDIRDHAEQLNSISEERIRDEFFSLLALKNLTAALRVADTVGVLEPVVPELKLLHGLSRPLPYRQDAWNHTLQSVEKLNRVIDGVLPHRTDNTAATFDLGMLIMQLDRYRPRLQEHLYTTWPNERPHRSILVLAALLHECGLPDGDSAIVSAEKSAERADELRLSNGERQRIRTIIGHYVDVIEMGELTPLTMHRFWYPLREAGIDVCFLAAANYLAMMGTYIDQHDWLVLVERIIMLLSAYFDQYDSIVEPSPVIDGNQLIEQLEIERGPLIGQLLTAIREAQVVGEVSTTDEALVFARNFMAL